MFQYQRFRSVTYGNNTAYINEATKRVLKHPRSTTDLGNIDTDCGFVGSDGSISPVSKASTAVLQKVVSNTGDLPSALSNYRIQVGESLSTSPTLVLGVNESGEAHIVPLNVLGFNSTVELSGVGFGCVFSSCLVTDF